MTDQANTKEVSKNELLTEEEIQSVITCEVFRRIRTAGLDIRKFGHMNSEECLRRLKSNGNVVPMVFSWNWNENKKEALRDLNKFADLFMDVVLGVKMSKMKAVLEPALPWLFKASTFDFLFINDKGQCIGTDRYFSCKIMMEGNLVDCTFDEMLKELSDRRRGGVFDGHES